MQLDLKRFELFSRLSQGQNMPLVVSLEPEGCHASRDTGWGGSLAFLELRGHPCQLAGRVGRGRDGFISLERGGCALSLYSSKELNKGSATRWDGERDGGAAGQNTGSVVEGDAIIWTL